MLKPRPTLCAIGLGVGVLCWGASPGRTEPQSRPEIAVLLLAEAGVDAGDGAVLTASVADALQRSGTAQVPSREALRQALVPGLSAGADGAEALGLEAFVADFERAQQRRDAGEDSAALEAFDALIDRLLTAAPESPRRWQLLEQVRLQRAATALLLGDEAAARAEYRRVRRLRPELELDAWAHGPQERRLFASAEVSSGATGTLMVSDAGKPAAARLFVDGQDIGLLPALVKQLPPGRYHLRVEDARGVSNPPRIVTVRPGQVDQVEVDLALERRLLLWQGPGLKLGNPESSHAAGLIRRCEARLRAGLQLQSVLWLRWDGRHAELRLGERRARFAGGAAGALPEGLVDALGIFVTSGEIVAPLEAHQLGPATPALVPPVADGQSKPIAAPWYRKPWLWIGVATVAAGAVAAGVLLAPSEGGSEGRVSFGCEEVRCAGP